MDRPTALVIGGSSGIGLATGRALAGDGARVHVVGRDTAKLEEVAREVPDIRTHRADATVREELEGVLEEIGTLDWLVVTMSGAEGMGAISDLDLDVLHRAFEAKFWGYMTAIQAALPHLNSEGSITLVGAISASVGMPGTAGLAAINGAVEALVKPLAAELAPIRVNGVSPGVVDTPWWSAMPDEEREAYFAQTAQALPVGQVGHPEDVAECLVLVATNPNMTGTIIECDGGARLASMG